MGTDERRVGRGTSARAWPSSYALRAALLLLLALSSVHPAWANDDAKIRAAAGTARAFLESDDADERARLAKKLDRFSGDIDAVIAELSARTYEPVEAGYHYRQHFTVPELAEERPDDLLYFTVPRSYRPDEPTGLIVFMHGGGAHSERTTPRYFMNFPDEGPGSSQLGDLFDETGLIAVGPSAPWDESCWYRWCMRESDDYLADVVRECQCRFNIDPQRVFLVGHSMGGFGAYHHAQRQPDRFAGVVVNAGSWTLGYWPTIRGTRLCIIQGVEDAEKDVRWHYTDIAYARWTDRLLRRKKLDYVYYEHERGHWVGHGKPYIAEFFEQSEALRRDPYYPHVVLASPVGFMRAYSFPVKHNRWLTLDEAAKGTIEYDRLLSDDDVKFDDWRLRYEKQPRRGAAIDAEIDDNTITVQTQNVARFTIWLHPRMIDTDEPVRVVVDGDVRFKKKVEPSLAVALESYERRHDWGLIYPIKVQIDCRE